MNPMTSNVVASDIAAEPLTFNSFRSGFPALAVQTYLSICDKMILHRRVRAAVDEFLDHL
jgi:hypothetical protein